LEFDLYIYNVDPTDPTDTITSAQLITPWQTYFAVGLPVSLSEGYSYNYFANVTIPMDQALGQIKWTVRFQGTYSNGTPFCASTGNACSDTFNLNIIADPAPLQTQVTSLTGQLATAKINATSIQQQVQSKLIQIQALQLQLQGLHQNLSTMSNDLNKTKADLGTASSALTTAKTQLNSTKATLSERQATLANYSNVYLPAGAGVPAALAAVIAFLYVKRGSKTGA